MYTKYKKFIVGSQAFFQYYKDFKPKDIDILYLVSKNEFFKSSRRVHYNNKCIFEWVVRSKEEWINTLNNNFLAMEVGKVLVPNVAKYIGLTIEDLKKLSPQFDKLDDRHKYEKVIYDSYIENNDFTLTNEQLDRAYEEYKRERK